MKRALPKTHPHPTCLTAIAALSISNDWYDANFCWWAEFDVNFGAPLGNATRMGTHAWVRNYTRANVFIDVSQGRVGVVDLLA